MTVHPSRSHNASPHVKAEHAAASSSSSDAAQPRKMAPTRTLSRRWSDAYDKARSDTPFRDGFSQALDAMVGKPPRPGSPELDKAYDVLVRDLYNMRDFERRYPEAVTAFGSARLEPGDPYYELAAELGERLAAKGFAVRTGAGPGIMNAVPVGYKRAGVNRCMPTQGVRIELPFEEGLSPSIDVNTMMKTFAIRRAALIWNSRALVVLPGGLGTVNELFESWVGASHGEVQCPIVNCPDSFFAPLLDAVEQVAVDKRGLISRADFDRVQRAQNAQDAIERLAQPLPPRNNGVDTSLRVRLHSLRHELGRGLATVSDLPPAVSVVGAQNLDSSEAATKFATELSQRLAEQGTAMRVGATGVVDRAVSEGVRKADASATIQRFVMADTVDQEEAGASTRHGTFRNRIVHREVLGRNTDAMVFLPSDLAGLDLLFAAACEMQTGRRERCPMILVGRDYWGPIVAGLRESLGSDGQFITNGDLDLMTVVDASTEGVTEALKLIRDAQKERSDDRPFAKREK